MSGEDAHLVKSKRGRSPSVVVISIHVQDLVIGQSSNRSCVRLRKLKVTGAYETRLIAIEKIKTKHTRIPDSPRSS